MLRRFVPGLVSAERVWRHIAKSVPANSNSTDGQSDLWPGKANFSLDFLEDWALSMQQYAKLPDQVTLRWCADDHMIVAGLDIGGTKIETRVFGDDWAEIARTRCDTPTNYAGLIAAVTEQVRLAEAKTGLLSAVGVGAAGLLNPQTGLTLTANLPASDRPFPQDITTSVGRPVTFINDAQAFALSEAAFGKAKEYQKVIALIIGTGVGGAMTLDGRLVPGPTRTGGEFGQIPAPAHLVQKYDLPLMTSPSGRVGCIETLISGAGLEMIHTHFTGQTAKAPDIAAQATGETAQAWTVWCALVAELIQTLTLVADPDVIILGGGLSRASGVVDDLSAAAASAQIKGFGTVPILLAEGGDASGARGAAYAAWQAVAHA